MSDELTFDELLETQTFFRLPSPALVEKDFYVARALRAIAATGTGDLRLVFGGGTALCRAHNLLRRMSEDIDLKIVGTEPIARQELRKLREALTTSLQQAGFEFDPNDRARRDSRNGSRYTIFNLPYRSLSRGAAALRSDIQIEVAAWPLYRPSVDLQISSFVAEAFKRDPEVTKIACVSITQTAAEKLVALTRRTAIELANAGGAHDPADIRHVYDLHMIRAHYDEGEVIDLAQQIMREDAENHGHHFAAYRDNPLTETRRSLAALETQPVYAERYEQFCRLMVYGDRPAYEEALTATQSLVARLPKN